MKTLDNILGLDFTSPHTSEVYSIVAVFDGNYPAEYDVNAHGEPIIDEACGNYITKKADDRIFYWDHETDQTVLIADNLQQVIDDSHEPEEVEFDESKVESVWICPEFAKSMGIEVPNDGWKKKPKA